MEQMLALGCFCGGGVLARHPKLRVAFLEANCSWLPWLLWRLDEAYELDGDVFAPDLKEKPSDYFKKQCVVSIEPEEVVATDVVKQLGGHNLVFSTDYPHVDSRYPEAVNHFLTLPLTENEKRKILWDNCMSYYAIAA
jgi:predicted TIM-barrel fold metal-dependent hydrolase